MIIFLFGEDEFRSQKKLSEIKEKFLEKNKGSFALDVFDFSETGKSVEDVIMAASSGGMFSKKRLVVVKFFLLGKFQENEDKMIDFLKKQEKSEAKDLILIFWEGGKLDKKNKTFLYLKKRAKSQEFKFLEGARLSAWIAGEVLKTSGNEVSLGSSEAGKIASFVGNDMFLLSNEIQKLVNFVGKGKIEEKHIDLLVKARIESDIFKTIDALGRRDKKNALALLHSHLVGGDDPFQILSMYFFQIRNLIKVKKFEEEGIAPQNVASRLKMHQFVVKKSMDQARGFTLSELKNLYQELASIDFRIKTGKTDVVIALDEFVAKS